MIVTTGTGATGWARSIHRERACGFDLPAAEDARLAYFVREAWPSGATGTSLTAGLLEPGTGLRLVSEMNEHGVALGDGIEADHPIVSWGCNLTIELASTRPHLVTG